MSTLDRRTVVRGAAWSIPVVAISAHAPAYAASTDPPSVAGMSACKLAGRGQNCQGYRVQVTFSVPPADQWDITITELAFDRTPVTATPSTFDVRGASVARTFEFCTDQKSPSHFELTLRYSATNRRTGATTKGLGGVTELRNVGNC